MSRQKDVPILLFVSANPDADLRVSEEFKKISNISEQPIQISYKPMIEIDELFDTFSPKKTIIIFHFAGHAGDEELLLQSSSISTQPFNKFLAQQNCVKLVFLNGCDTKKQAEHLVALGIDNVIATCKPVADKEAIEFANFFYQRLFFGDSIKASFQNAENYLKSLRTTNKSQKRIRLHPDFQEKEVKAWKLFSKEEASVDWNLSQVIQDPFLGLPKLIEKDYPLPEEPFVSIRRYSSKEAKIFFGRGWEIRKLYHQIISPESSPLILLFGASGTGKSSFLDAGLIPRLKRRAVYKRKNKNVSLLDLMNEATSELNELIYYEHSQELLKWSCIILDQVEESFIFPIQEEWNSFLKTVAEHVATRSNMKIILSFREEYLASVEEKIKHFPEIVFSKTRLNPLGKENIKEIIRSFNQKEITAKYYFTFKTGLDKEIADRLYARLSGEKNKPLVIAPILQIILANMWLAYQSKIKLREINKEEHFEFDSDIYYQYSIHKLDKFYSQQIAKLDKKFQANKNVGLILDLLFFHVTSLNTSATHHEKYIETTYPHIENILSLTVELKDLYLLTYQEPYYSLTHDVLAPIIRREFENSVASGQRTYRILTNKVEEYKKDNRNYLDERDLQIVEDGLNGMRSLNEYERELVRTSRSERNLLQRSRKVRRVLFSFLTLIILGYSAITVLLNKNLITVTNDLTSTKAQLTIEQDSLKKVKESIFLLINQQDSLTTVLNNTQSEAIRAKLEVKLKTLVAKEATQRATYQKLRADSSSRASMAQQLAFDSQELLKKENNLLALHIAYQAYLLAPNSPPDEVEKALYKAFYENLEYLKNKGKEFDPYPAYADQGDKAVITKDGQYILVVKENDTFVWNAKSVKNLGRISIQGQVDKIAVSPDNRYILVANDDKLSLYPFGYNTLRPLETLIHPSSETQVIDIKFSSDSRKIIINYNDRIVPALLWDLTTNQKDTIEHNGSAKSLAISNDVRYLVYRLAKNTPLRLEDTKNNKTHELPSYNRVLSTPDDQYLIGDVENELQIYSLEKKQIHKRIPLADKVLHLKLSPDGQRLATVPMRRTAIQVYNILTGEKLKLSKSTEITHVGTRVFFSSDNKYILVARSSKIRLWNAQKGYSIFEHKLPQGQKIDARGVAFTSENRFIFLPTKKGFQLLFTAQAIFDWLTEYNRINKIYQPSPKEEKRYNLTELK